MQGGGRRHFNLDVPFPRRRPRQRDQLAVRPAAADKQAARGVVVRAEARRAVRQEAGHFHPVAAHRLAQQGRRSNAERLVLVCSYVLLKS